MISLLVLFERPPPTMDAALATIVDGGRAICQKHK
jgi:hypothetical protein